MKIALFVTGLALAALPQVAAAEVTALEDDTFIIAHSAQVGAPRSDVWEALVVPGHWWDGAHTYSGDAANMTIDPRAGGCFCEAVPAGTIGPLAGSVEHMRVIYVMPEVNLRMTGGLGPLQAEAVSAVLTVGIESLPEGGSRIDWEYVVSGHLRMPAAQLAPLVDMVLGQQVARLAARLGEPVEASE